MSGLKILIKPFYASKSKYFDFQLESGFKSNHFYTYTNVFLDFRLCQDSK